MCKQLIGGLLLVVCLFQSGCDADGVMAAVGQEREDFHFTKPLNAGGRFSIENFNGSVEISGWDRNEVEIDGTKYARTKAYLDEVKIDVQSSANLLSIRTIPPVDRWNTNSGAKYVIRVPRRTVIDMAGSSNGHVKLDGVDGMAKIRTSNGGVTARSVKGMVEATTSNGNVELEDVVGGVRVVTSNAWVHGDNLHGEFNARTSNGGIRARLFDVPSNATVKAATSNGGVDLTLDRVRGDIRASTSNSNITLRVPSSTNAQLDARTSNASVSSDLAVTGQRSNSKKHLEGTIGSGGPQIDLSTSNGSIRITKGASI